jgi:hypothetical protein
VKRTTILTWLNQDFFSKVSDLSGFHGIYAWKRPSNKEFHFFCPHCAAICTCPTCPRQADPTAPPTLRATRTPAAVRAAWGNLNSLHDISIDRAGPIGIPIDLTIAARSPLASAQFAIHQRLRPAMGMALCGDAINNLTAWWPPARPFHAIDEEFSTAQTRCTTYTTRPRD